jgi:hypothetical protein
MEENNPTQAGGSYVPPSRPDNIREKLSVVPSYLWIILTVLIITTIVLLTLLLVPSIRNLLRNKLGRENLWTPPTQVTPAILGGTQSYTISGGTQGLPQITNLTLDPQDPKVGKNQTISISANNSSPIKEVIAVLHLDNNKDFEYPLDLNNGTNTNGTWSKTITFPYTYNNAYRVTVKARNEDGLGNMETISIR